MQKLCVALKQKGASANTPRDMVRSTNCQRLFSSTGWRLHSDGELALLENVMAQKPSGVGVRTQSKTVCEEFEDAR